MLKNKLFFTLLILGIGCSALAQPATLKDVTHPKPPAYRVGISETPEKQYVQALEDINGNKPEKKYANIDNSTNGEISDMTYADLSIKQLSKEIAQELQYDEKDMLADLSLLWQGAAMQSDTINFALYKLANPDADKPDEKSIKNVLKTIASMSTLVGASVGSPVIAGSSLIGGNIFNIFSQDTKALNYKYTKVNDADMIILIRKVEDLQQRAVDLYYDYMSAKKQLEFSTELVQDRKNKFEHAQKNNAPRELIVIIDAYYRTSIDKQKNAKAEFYSKRAALEQFVGHDTFIQFENELAAREKLDTKAKQQDTDVDEYSNTIKAIENFTDSLPKNAQNQEEHYNAPKSLQDIRLPEEGGFYSDFPTGFAVSATLDEFLTTGQTVHKGTTKKIQPKKVDKTKKVNKPKKEKAVKEKPLKQKQEKISKEKTPKIKKEKSEVAIEKQKVKKGKKEKPVKFKKEKIKKETEVTTDVDSDLVESAGNPYIYNDDEAIETKSGEELPQIIHNEVKSSEEIKNAGKPAKEKKVKVKKVKDKTEYAYGQPLTKYPKNSTKDLIFLHGQDKRAVPSVLLTRQQKALQNPNSEGELPIKPLITPIPKTPFNSSDPLDDLKMLEETEINSVSNSSQRPVDNYGLLPLYDIKVPDIKRDGYSIHSETLY